ncbi:hypothetical protein PAPYR_2254 [Paratrimastix pyriformis]|uniref:Fido domain-containing protein n=1 Tax=Paratrimastix pyriformis TaxID=342808 RepID=A0ABQ8URZ6_9EUKA|nr:hypothetical protein PAPYR_2254 [Paratrimastix pyriformis]
MRAYGTVEIAQESDRTEKLKKHLNCPVAHPTGGHQFLLSVIRMPVFVLEGSDGGGIRWNYLLILGAVELGAWFLPLPHTPKWVRLLLALAGVIAVFRWIKRRNTRQAQDISLHTLRSTPPPPNKEMIVHRLREETKALYRLENLDLAQMAEHIPEDGHLFAQHAKLFEIFVLPDAATRWADLSKRCAIIHGACPQPGLEQSFLSEMLAASNQIEGYRTDARETERALRHCLDLPGGSMQVSAPAFSLCQAYTQALGSSSHRELLEFANIVALNRTITGLPNPLRSRPEQFVIITGTPVLLAHPLEVRSLLNQLIDRTCALLDDPERDPVTVVINFHHAFTRIHPFVDGNGRLVRLLSHLLLARRGLVPLLIPATEGMAYKMGLQRWDEGSPVEFSMCIWDALDQMAARYPSFSPAPSPMPAAADNGPAEGSCIRARTSGSPRASAASPK